MCKQIPSTRDAVCLPRFQAQIRMSKLHMMILASFIALLANFRVCRAQLCTWQTSTPSKRYEFDIATPVSNYPHGVRSEDGFYKVIQTDADTGYEATFWFQLCEHMKFNHDPPVCENCQSCGGSHHCGETCSALQAVRHPGYSLCRTLGFASSISFSLLDSQNPEQGLIANMSSVVNGNGCSMAVSIICSKSGVEPPSAVTQASNGECNFSTSLRHPGGCPVVTSLKGGGMGWFGMLLIIFICLFIVYLAVGIAYRMTVLGVSGLEAIPNLDFWKSVPSKIQAGLQFVSSQVTACYNRVAPHSYTRVSE